jgi:hypothetical protein
MEEYMKSRAFRLKNRLRSFLITANQLIMRNTTETVTTQCTRLSIPKEVAEALLFTEDEYFLVRSDFMNLLDTLRIAIKKISVTPYTGKDDKELVHTVHLHLESHGICPEDQVIDLEMTVDFKVMPLCGVRNLLINGHLIEHLNKIILQRIYEL